MKKIITFLILLIIPLAVHAENDYKVLTHYIDSEIEISGNLRVKEMIIVDGSLEYFTRTLNYASFDGVWDKKEVNLDNGPIYNGTGVYNFAASAYKYNNEDIDFNNLNANVKEYFTELNPKKVGDKTYKITKKTGENSYNIYYKNNGKTVIYLEYIVGDIIVSHNDVRELNYTFKNLTYDAADTYLRVLIPFQTDSNLYHAYLHGNNKGEYEEIEKSGQKYGIFAHYPNTKKEINVRITFPLEQISIDEGTNHSNIDALDEIIKIENQKLQDKQTSNNINKYAKYVIIALSIIYVLISYLIYKQHNNILNFMYLALGLLISLFNFLFKTNIIYIYLILIIPVSTLIINKFKKKERWWNAIFW